MTDDIWTTRDLPALCAIVDIDEREEGEGRVGRRQLQRYNGFDATTVRRSLRVLTRQRYFEDAQVIANGDIWMVGPRRGR